MKRWLKKNSWQILIALAAITALLLLFIKAQAVDPSAHNQVVRDIAELQKRDTELGEAVMQLHYRLANNYDAVTALMQRIKILANRLEQYQKNGWLPDSPEARRELAELRVQIERRSNQLDEFKSNNAVMKNSLIYLPSMVDNVLALLPNAAETTLEKFEFLLRDALLVSVKGDEATIAQLAADIERAEQAIPGLPGKAQQMAVYVVRHAKTLLTVDRVMPELLTNLSAYKSQHLGVGLDRMYQTYYEQQQRRADIYRLFLLLAALLMLAYSIFVYFRLKVKGQQLEHALAEITNQQHALNEHAIVSITDVKGNITYVNDKFIEISGYSADELIGKNHRMIKSGQHDQEFFRELWQTVANGRVWHGQVKNRTKKGGFYWVEATVVPVMDHEGKPYQYVSMRTDITAQKAMELQVQSERRLLKNVMDTLGEGVYMLDQQGRCTYMNSEAEEIVGWTIEEVMGHNLHDILHSQRPDGTQVSADNCPIRQSTMKNEEYRSETEYFQHKNGTLFPIAIVASPMMDGDTVTGSVAAFQDISERKFTERELLRAKESAEAASRAKGDFLATMSHEIRTPMNGIIGMTELALDTEMSAEQREYLNMVKSSADALLTIINDILDFSKIESGKMELELVDFDVRNLFVSAEKTLAIRAAQKGLELVYDVDSAIPDLLTGDPGRMRQVLTNLLGNAVKFSSHGAITLRMKLLMQSTDGFCVRIEVADQGIGIPADKLAHIFEAFTQADTSTTRKYGGTGLGLAISGKLVAAMGGELSVESQVGIGSVFGFTVTLPVAKNQLTEAICDELAGLSVLIVDDNATNCQLLSQLIKKWGMRPIVAGSGAEGMAMLIEAQQENSPFDLLLLDAVMADIDGFDFAAQVKLLPDMPRALVMLLSPANLRADTERCRRAGIANYLSKPIDRRELLNVLKASIGLQADEIAVAQPALTAQTSLNVLLAEDNRVNQKLAITLLEKWGHRVVLANNGVEAVEHAARVEFDVILMDLQMPEMSGLEATRLIREQDQLQGRHSRIIAMTANAMSEDRQRCLDAGMDDYIAKPLNTEKLRDLLAGVESSSEVIKPATYGYMSSLKAADPWVIETIGQAFLEECDPQMVAITEAIASGDKVLLMRGAHTLRGLIGNFHARKIEEIASQIEQCAERDDLPGAAGCFAALQSEMNLFKIALIAYLAS
ncbi:MAG: response regulator [Nitrosomonadales bacterium]